MATPLQQVLLQPLTGQVFPTHAHHHKPHTSQTSTVCVLASRRGLMQQCRMSDLPHPAPLSPLASCLPVGDFTRAGPLLLLEGAATTLPSAAVAVGASK